jgi:hypothetical protein
MLHPDVANKLTSFVVNGESVTIIFIETQQVSEGVECDVYTFLHDDSRDLAIVTVIKNHKTPLQRIVSGTKTIEGFVSGSGTLSIGSIDETVKIYSFNSKSEPHEVIVSINQTMQWCAVGDNLRFYEICEPSYADGRFETLS